MNQPTYKNSSKIRPLKQIGYIVGAILLFIAFIVIQIARSGTSGSEHISLTVAVTFTIIFAIAHRLSAIRAENVTKSFGKSLLLSSGTAFFYFIGVWLKIPYIDFITVVFSWIYIWLMYRKPTVGFFSKDIIGIFLVSLLLGFVSIIITSVVVNILYALGPFFYALLFRSSI